ncbi:MAG: hypothetical protein HY665_04510 [Chloroflexi bacterium]|nr:hypothetical protein [Chloroflexota bacterium]
MGKTRKPGVWWGLGFLILLAGIVVIAASCQGPAGPPAAAPAPAISVGTLSGKVTNSLTKTAVSGVTVTIDPAIQGVTITTDSNGAYSAELPIGVYTVSYKIGNFDSVTQTASVVAGQTITKDVVLKPTKPVVVNAGAAQTAAPGAIVSLKASAIALDGSSVTGYEWTQTAGVEARISNPKSDTLQVTLSNAAAYKEALIKGIKTKERLAVLGINPHALEAAETATFRVTATTSSGKYSGTVNVAATLPYVITLGLSNVPVGEPVLLNAPSQGQYMWSIAGPNGSKAALQDGASRNPGFTPDVVGKYAITDRISGAKIDVYAGTWAGAISGQDDKGRPLSAGCTVCHDGKTAPDNFTAWAKSGHAEIFTQNINDPAGHWAINCAQCHTVGYNPAVKNNGFDEAVAAENWQVPPHGEVGYWTMMQQKFPKTTSMANIQCENCHGPNNSPLHANKEIDTARVSLSADVCGSCHGEPARHGRFQQWEESRHAGTDTTPARGLSSASCARCHSAQGFLIWLKQGDLEKQIQGAKGNATVAELAAMGITADKVEPVTCAVCHEPHNPGTVSGDPTNATVRIQNVTKMLPAGFKAENVGKGALCITCHNTRNAVHNIEAPPTSYSAPHTASQADVLMGQNAYLVEVPSRSPHASVKDSCVTCHMEKTPPPPEFSYQGAGTNHSFKASVTICGECHSNTLDGKAFQTSVKDLEHELGEAMGAYLLKKIGTQVVIKDYTPHKVGTKSYDLKSDAFTLAKSNIASVEPTEPHGQIGFIFKFKNPVSFTYRPPGEDAHTVSLTEAEVQLGDVTTDGTKALIPVTDVLVQVGWNFFLIEGDGSAGVHNPEFATEVMHASIEALK